MLTADVIREAIPHVLLRAELPELGERTEGKVRDAYLVGGQRMLIASDRISAFDRVVGAIPFKGQVLNQLSAWWFERTADVVANHVVDVPDPNVTMVRDVEPLPVEVIVRGYITGVTSTALWTLYEKGVERPYGLELPAGLKRNQRLPTPVITPTTKAAAGAHDERLTAAEVVERELVAAELWQQVQAVALALFARGQAVAAGAGLLLVDTKYEFGLDGDELLLIDELHTPDSSRYWVADSYAAALAVGAEPENFDKEYVRRWFVEQGYRGEGAPPTMPEQVVVELSQRYISAYERLTGREFEPGSQPADERLRALAARVRD